MSDHDPSATQLASSAAERCDPDEVADGGTNELETSRRDLQSLKTELAQANSDLSNLTACSPVAMVLLDRSLAVKRYTPVAATLFSLTPADLGRPLGDVTLLPEHADLAGDAENVFRSLVPAERLVSDETKRLLARLQPCRTLEGQICGVMLTLLDVTEQHEAAEVLALDLEATTLLSELSLRLVPEGDLQVLLDAVLDVAAVIMRADAGTVQLYDSERETLRLFATRGIPRHVADHFAELSAASRSPCGRALESGRRVTTLFDASLPDPTGDNRWHREEAGLLSAQSTPLIARNGRILGMLSTHWKTSHFPNDRELRFFDLLTRLAADVIERAWAEKLLRGQKHELEQCGTRVEELEEEVNLLLARLGDPPRYQRET